MLAALLRRLAAAAAWAVACSALAAVLPGEWEEEVAAMATEVSAAAEAAAALATDAWAAAQDVLATADFCELLLTAAVVYAACTALMWCGCLPGASTEAARCQPAEASLGALVPVTPPLAAVLDAPTEGVVFAASPMPQAIDGDELFKEVWTKVEAHGERREREDAAKVMARGLSCIALSPTPTRAGARLFQMSPSATSTHSAAQTPLQQAMLWPQHSPLQQPSPVQHSPMPQPQKSPLQHSPMQGSQRSPLLQHSPAQGSPLQPLQPLQQPLQLLQPHAPLRLQDTLAAVPGPATPPLATAAAAAEKLTAAPSPATPAMATWAAPGTPASQAPPTPFSRASKAPAENLSSPLAAGLLSVLNNGSFEELIALRNLGMQTARAILKYREGNRIESVEQLAQAGVRSSVLSKIVAAYQ